MSLVLYVAVTDIVAGQIIQVAGLATAGYNGSYVVASVSQNTPESRAKRPSRTLYLPPGRRPTRAAARSPVKMRRTKTGYGTSVTFQGDNAYTGVTNITQGVLITDNPNALSGVGGTVVENGRLST